MWIPLQQQCSLEKPSQCPVTFKGLGISFGLIFTLIGERMFNLDLRQGIDPVVELPPWDYSI
jgi:hypothetical protein